MNLEKFKGVVYESNKELLGEFIAEASGEVPNSKCFSPYLFTYSTKEWSSCAIQIASVIWCNLNKVIGDQLDQSSAIQIASAASYSPRSVLYIGNSGSFEFSAILKSYEINENDLDILHYPGRMVTAWQVLNDVYTNADNAKKCRAVIVDNVNLTACGFHLLGKLVPNCETMAVFGHSAKFNDVVVKEISREFRKVVTLQGGKQDGSK